MLKRRTHKDRIRLSLLLAALILGALLLALALRPTKPSHPDAPATVVEQAPPNALETAKQVNQHIARAPLAELPKLGPLPASLQGAEPEVHLHTDANGNLIVENDLMDLFEFYLAGLGDEPLETVLARIRQALAGQLQGAALEQAQDLLRRYVDYKIALVDLDQSSATQAPNGQLNVDALRQRFQDLNALRQSYFSTDENSAFFQLDNVQDEYSLQRIAIAENASLSEPQRAQAIAALDQQLPAEMREMRERVSRDADLYTQTEHMKQQGASAEEIYQVRAQELGDQAAANLAQLDRERAQWKQRLADYAKDRDSIRQSGLSQADQQVAIDRLIDSRFSDLERLRVRALDAHL